MSDVFQIVTDRIMEELNNGIIPWHKPWCSVTGGAFNRVSRKPYSLLNRMMLRHNGEYATIRQWTELGGRVKQDGRPEIVTFWKHDNLKSEDPESDSSEEARAHSKRPVLRYYRVYHISQIDGVEPLAADGEKFFDTEPITAAERLFKDYVSREKILLEAVPSNEAYYSPAKDLIHIPAIRQYANPEEFYSTALHEAVHSTGHIRRLGRAGLKDISFGSENYSAEELVAEIGSAALLYTLGIATDKATKNSASYVWHWLQALKKDRRMIVFAAGQAQKAVDFILHGR